MTIQLSFNELAGAIRNFKVLSAPKNTEISDTDFLNAGNEITSALGALKRDIEASGQREAALTKTLHSVRDAVVKNVKEATKDRNSADEDKDRPSYGLPATWASVVRKFQQLAAIIEPGIRFNDTTGEVVAAA